MKPDRASAGEVRSLNENKRIAGECGNEPDRRCVLGINFACYTMEALVGALMRGVPAGAGPRMITTANIDHVVRLTKDEQFRAAYAWSWVTTADGWPVYLYARLRGLPIARVTGADLFARAMMQFDPRRDRLFFVISNPVLASRLGEWMQARNFPADSFAFEAPPFGFERDTTLSQALARRVKSHRTTHLIMGVGAPKSETWSYIHREYLGDTYVLCVGASAEFFTGLKWRAPRIFQICGLEWLWRFMQEPKRLFRRYFVDSWRFFAVIGRDILQERSRRRSPGT